MKKLVLILITIGMLFSTTYAYTLTKIINESTLISPAEAGSEVRIRYNDIRGYTFEGWETNGIELGSGSYKDIKFIMPENDVEVKVKLSLTNYTITYNLNGGTTSNPEIYTIKDEITLSQPTKEGYTFLGWTGSNGLIPEKIVKIPKGSIGNKIYTANWESDLYKIEVSQTGKGTISTDEVILLKNNVNIFEIGNDENLTFYIVPDDDYEILDVILNGESLGIIDEYTFNEVTTDQTLFVEFSDNNRYLFRSRINNVRENFEAYVGESITLTAVPKSGYRFLNWITTGIALPNIETVTFTMPENDVTVVANFELE